LVLHFVGLTVRDAAHHFSEEPHGVHSLVEGVVDLAFREEVAELTGWTVVDFRTDREITSASDQYAAQVSAYVAAIGAATGLSSRGILLVV
jgi:hypothetical protein